MSKERKYSGGKCFNAVWYSNLTTDEKIVIHTLLSGCNINRPHEWRYCFQDRLVNFSSLSLSTVKRIIKKLVKEGYIDEVKGTGQCPNYYRATIKIFNEYALRPKTQRELEYDDYYDQENPEETSVETSVGTSPPTDLNSNAKKEGSAGPHSSQNDHEQAKKEGSAGPHSSQKEALKNSATAKKTGQGDLRLRSARPPNNTKGNIPRNTCLLKETQNLQQVQNLGSGPHGRDHKSDQDQGSQIVTQDEQNALLGIIDPFETEELARDIVRQTKPGRKSIQAQGDESNIHSKAESPKKAEKTVLNDMPKGKETLTRPKRMASCTQLEGFKGKLFVDHYFAYLTELWGDKAPRHHRDQIKAVKIVQKHGLELAQVVADYYWESDYYMADRYHIIRCYSFRLFSDLFDEILANFSKNISLEDRDRRIKGVKNRAKQRRMRGNFNYQP